ncbi:MAG: glycosyltransferase family 4 protein [Bacteroidales bacterium]|nr:glycosyltransferase family 4 protein [Bacteroidales bacterium]
MRIGFDAKRAFTNRTGLGNYSRSTIHGLCRMFPENEYALYTPSAEKTGLFTPPSIAVICTPSTIWSKQLKGYWRTFGLPRQLASNGTDIYHGLSNEIPFGIEKTGIKSVVTIHDLIFMRYPDLYPPIDRHIYFKKVRHAVKTADRIIAISKQTRDDIVQLLDADERKIRIVYQGCNPWFYNINSEEILHRTAKKYNLPKKFLLYVGTIEERKDLLTIIRAIHENGIDIPLVAVGRKTAYYEKVKRYIEENKVRNIHFHHHIDNADLPAVYQQAEIFIYPSKYEGFGIPVLEALNSHIPVITSQGGCLEETAGNGGLFIEPGNADQLATAINKISVDRELRESLIKKGTAHAKLFREEKTIPKLFEIYQQCTK